MLGVGVNSSDFDLLCTSKILSRDYVFGLIKNVCETCGMFSLCKIVQNKHVLLLKLISSNVSVDIQYVNLSDSADPYYETSLGLLLEPRYILDQMDKLEKTKLFTTCLSWLRTQMKTSRMYGSQYGYLSGISLAILTAYLIKNNSDIKYIFDFKVALKELDIDSPISLSGNMGICAKNPCDNMLYIGSNIPPYKNTVRTISRSTKYLIKNQFMTCFDHYLDFPYSVTFSVYASDNVELNDAIIWFNGVVPNMLVSIEKKCRDTVLCPENSWNFSGLTATWILWSTKYFTYIDYVAQEIINKSTGVFSDVYFSFTNLR
jgi:hypothetical protein